MERVEESITLSQEHLFPFWLAIGECWRGWEYIHQGDPETGIAYMQRGIEAYQAIGSGVALPYVRALLAQALAQTGRVQEGMQHIDAALAQIDKWGEVLHAAEVYRAQGELFLQQDGAQLTRAEASFHTALDIARAQDAKSWELRAAMSLSRLWQSQGKRQEAYDLLTPLYNWFTEGLDTADLQEAKALLAELT